MKKRFALVLAFFAVALIAFVGCEEDVENDPIINACFEYSPDADIKAGDTVSFTNCSQNAKTYEWNFGDGNTATTENPTHVYADSGKYQVSLKAISGDDSHTTSLEVYIGIAPQPKSYILNYGSYGSGNGSVDYLDMDADALVNGYYNSVNGFPIESNIQHAYEFNQSIYFMGNVADEVFFVNKKSFQQTENGITDQIIKPRYMVGEGNTLYVSCWGGDIWTDESLSYIVKIDANNHNVLGTIALPGGPEGLAIANGKLYAALNYKDSIAVINMADDAISYIVTPAVSSYFIKDNNDNLYVSLVSTYSDFSTEDGLGYINTTTDEIETYQFTGVSSSYVNVLSANADFSKVYLMTSAYDENWNLSGAIAVFDVATKSFESNLFVEGISGLNGVAVNPINDEIYGFIAPGAGGNGTMKSYHADGTFIKDYTTGVSPFMMITIE